MSFFHGDGQAKDRETARRTSPQDNASGLMQPPLKTTPLSEGLRRFLVRQEQEGLACLTLAEYRGTGWSFLEFLKRDPPVEDLESDFFRLWADWLRKTPHYRRGRGSYPAHFSPDAVANFFLWTPPKDTSDKFRKNATVAKYLRQGATILRWLGVSIQIERRKRIKRRRLPAIVPKFDDLTSRWQSILACGKLTSSHRRQIVLTQALILLWGTRVREALTASLEDVEGHWALVEGKTGMRITYLNSQAQGLIRALQGQTAWSWAAARHTRITGWPWGHNKWHADVRKCGVDDGPKPQQDLRKRFTTWVKARDSDVEKLLAGHGGDVIFDYYLDILERAPGVMEQFDLPALDGFQWPAPIYLHRPQTAATWGPAEEASAAARLTPPRRLYQRFDAWLEEQERRAAE